MWGRMKLEMESRKLKERGGEGVKKCDGGVWGGIGGFGGGKGRDRLILLVIEGRRRRRQWW